jgi:hypothetical protein
MQAQDSVAPKDLVAGSKVPNWLPAAMDAPLVQRLRDIVRALTGFAMAPRAYAAQWASGETSMPNPLFLMAASAALVSPVRQEFDRFVGIDNTTLVHGMLASLSPYTYYATIGLVAHGGLRAIGPVEPLRASIGVSLMVGASVGTLLSMLSLASSATLYAAFGTINFAAPTVSARVQSLSPFLIEIPYALLLLSMALGLAGVHRLPLWRTAAAVLLGVIVSGRLLGMARIVHGVVNFWWRSSGLTITGYGMGL